MNCVSQIISIAAKIIGKLLKLPSEEIYEEVRVPVRVSTGSSTTLTSERKLRVRYQLAQRYEKEVNFKAAARRIGALLQAHYDIAPLVQSSGPTAETDQDTAGVRFLGKLIDTAIGGVETPSALGWKLRRICKAFEAQLVAGEVAVTWIYPIPGIVQNQPVKLANAVKVVELGPARLEVLERLARVGLVSSVINLQTTSVLAIHQITRVPFGLTGRENSDILEKVALAFVLANLPPPALLTSWQEPRGVSLFGLGEGPWFAPWASSPIAFFPRVTINAERALTLSRVYKSVEACPEAIRKSLAIKRLLSAAQRDNYEDRVIDLWIALESLLLGNGETSELQYRMTLRAAVLVHPNSFAEFERCFKKAYGDRSKVVHGARHKADEATGRRCEWTFALLKSIVLHSIRAKSLPNLSGLEERILRRGRAPSDPSSERT